MWGLVTIRWSRAERKSGQLTCLYSRIGRGSETEGRDRILNITGLWSEERAGASHSVSAGSREMTLVCSFVSGRTLQYFAYRLKVSRQ